MTTPKDEQVIYQLLQHAYDFSYIPSMNCEVNADLQALLPEVNQMMIDSLDRWFETEGREFSEEHRRKTSLRFCLTLGAGASWFFYQQEEPIGARALFDIMAAPRGEDAMDEFIEDELGIWFSSDSDKHSQWLSLCDCCYEVALLNYDLADNEERFRACLTAMHAGAIVGIGIIMHMRSKTKYEGDFSWDANIWKSFISDKHHSPATLLDKWTQMCLKAGRPITGNFVSLPKEKDSYEHQIDCYHQLTLHNGVGIQTIFHVDNGIPSLTSITPRIDSSRTHYLIVDKVLERASGAEATIVAHFADDPLTQVTFYDTEYLKSRDLYFAGQCYVFDLYAMAYHTAVVPKRTHTPLHSFMQIGELHSEICRFSAPIQEVYNDLDITIPALYEVEVGIPYRNIRSGKKHDISVFIPTLQVPDGEQKLIKGAHLEGTLILMGKMRVHANFEERPCTTIRSFFPLTQRGTPRRFTHKCKASEVGQEMNETERHEFAKKVMKQIFGHELEVPFEDEGVDFLASRHRSLWVKSDEEYNAAECFPTEDITPGLSHYYQTGRLPVMVYVTLYDEQGERCQWVKGTTYTAQLHYGSMLPGQRMAPREAYKHEMLMTVLFEAFRNFHTFPLCKVLHKDLYYTSHNLLDPIITREEFLIHIEGVFEANRFAPEGPLKAKLVREEDGYSYIELTYPEGIVDRLDVKTHHNLITEIHIRNVKQGAKSTTR